MSGRQINVFPINSSYSIHSIPQGRDNYAWLIVHDSSGDAVLVDAMEASSLKSYCEQNELKIRQIWNTHHHYDHVGANKGLEVEEVLGSHYDSENSRIPHQTRSLGDGDEFLWKDLSVEVIDVPGHTLGHIAYLVGKEHLFCGDSLFLSGCGRMFEGNPAMMVESLQKFLSLDSEVKVYCAHEYSLSNLAFARSLESDSDWESYEAELVQRLNERSCTLPSKMEKERVYNPFLRVIQDEMYRAEICDLSSAGRSTPESAFAELRSRKDNF